MSTETTNKKIKIDNGTTFGKTYTDKAVDERLQGLVSTATFTPVQEKANNSLQKPAGLTKTKLVGVGTNGQENIEIGDNLTLANGKLSATGGGSLGRINITQLDLDNLTGTYTGSIDENTIKADSPLGSFTINSSANDYGYILWASETSDGLLEIRKMDMIGGTIDGKKYTFVTQDLFIETLNSISEGFQLKIYSHFITMTDSSNNVSFYLTIQNTDNTTFTADTLASYLAGKKVLANGNLHGVVPTYIAGEGGVIKIYYMTPGDSNINPTPDEYQDLSSFTITDLVSPVE